MGCSPADDPDCLRSEQPVRHVTLSFDYLLAETETTNGQYRRCVEAGDCGLPGRRPRGEMEKVLPRKFEHFPVVYLDRPDAEAFCAFAGGRLPTEAEWERAAKGGSSRKFPFDVAERTANSDGVEGADQFRHTSPVRSFPPNAFGLFDMAGNVEEFCVDAHQPYDGSSLYVSDPVVRDDDKPGAVRGGGWRSKIGGLRAAARSTWPGRNGMRDTLGVRCAKDTGPATSE